MKSDLEERIIMPCISKTCNGTKTRFEYIGSEGVIWRHRHIYQCPICEQVLVKYEDGEFGYK